MSRSRLRSQEQPHLRRSATLPMFKRLCGFARRPSRGNTIGVDAIPPCFNDLPVCRPPELPHLPAPSPQITRWFFPNRRASTSAGTLYTARPRARNIVVSRFELLPGSGHLLHHNRGSHRESPAETTASSPQTSEFSLVQPGLAALAFAARVLHFRQTQHSNADAG